MPAVVGALLAENSGTRNVAIASWISAALGIAPDIESVVWIRPSNRRDSAGTPAAANRARDKFPDGAWLVRLADLSVGAEVSGVESAIVSAIGISDQSTTGLPEKLLSFLPDRRLLLVLDNCEHVLAAVRTRAKTGMPTGMGTGTSTDVVCATAADAVRGVAQ